MRSSMSVSIGLGAFRGERELPCPVAREPPQRHSLAHPEPRIGVHPHERTLDVLASRFGSILRRRPESAAALAHRDRDSGEHPSCLDINPDQARGCVAVEATGILLSLEPIDLHSAPG